MGKIKRLTQKEREEVLEKYNKGENSEKLGKEYGVSGVAIRATIKRLGGSMRGPREAHLIYTLDENCLNTLTDESAYWLGFLAADGYVLKREENSQQRFGVNVSIIDKDILMKLRSFFGSNAPLTYKKGRHQVHKNGTKSYTKESVGWSARSDKLCSVLHKYGITTNKSNTLKPSSTLCVNKHFWRGVWDGDGHIGKGNNCPIASLVGSYPMLEAFVKWAESNIEYRVKIKSSKSNNTTAHTSLHGEGAKILLHKLYIDINEDCPSLDRKKNEAMSLWEKYKNKTFRVIPDRKPPYIYPPLSYRELNKALDSFNKLTMYDSCSDFYSVTKHSTEDMFSLVLKKRSIGMYASGYFHEEERLKVRVAGLPSPIEKWEDLEERQKIIYDAETKKHSNIKASWMAHSRAAWGFPPAVAKALYQKFEAQNILDPCAGWGDRLVAALSMGDVSYTGIDPNNTAVNIYKKVINTYQSKSTGNITIYPFAIEDLDIPQNQFDLAFTSPPYYNWEEYSTDETQSCIRYKTPEEWRDKFLFSLVDKCYIGLENKGVMAINISPISDAKRKLIHLDKWLFQIAIKRGFMPIGTIFMRTRNFKQGLEPILCFRK